MVPGLAQVAVAERGHFPVQIRTNPGHFGLGDASVGAEGLDQVVDFPGRDAVEVGLHHDGEQGLVDPPTLLEQGGEERPGAQLRDLQIKVPSRRAQGSWSGAVAIRGAVAGAFKRGGADERARFRIDQFLIQRFGRDPDAVSDIGEFEFSQQVEQGRLV